MLENIRLSFQGIWSHKMRSFLTMLGIIIGIASIIAIVSTIQGTNEQLMQNVVGSGTNAVDINLTQGSADNTLDFSWNSVPYGIPVLTESIREELLNVPDVEDATFYVSRTYADGIYYLSQSLQGADVYGIDSHYFDVNGYIVRTGREFVDSDYKDFHKVAIIDQDAASTLFQEESALGKTIEISGEPFVIIGVAQPKSEFEPVINSIEEYYTYMGDDSSTGKVYIPYQSWPIIYQYDEPQNVSVRAADVKAMTTVGKPCAEILNSYLALTTEAIFKNKGTLDKFVGDATMAVFNSPFDLDDYEFRAVCAAWDIVQGGIALEGELMERFGRSVGFGVGVNCGPAVVGNIGCDFRMDFTAIGDTVNTAARLEANAKKGQVLISDVLYERVKDRVEVEEVGAIPLKGKSKEVFVYAVTGIKGERAT